MWTSRTNPPDSGRRSSGLWPFALALVLSLLLGMPAFEAGFSLDDFYLLALIEGWYDFETPPVNLYTSFMEAPNIPWWRSPETRVSFWRPLSSALLRLDHALFGRAEAAWQAHSLLWLAAFLAVVGALFSRLPRRLGIPTFLLLALDEAHAMTSGVIANRHAVVAATLAFLGLLLHLRWREDGWRPGLPLSLAAYTAGLLAGETALAVLAYVLAVEALRADPLPDRVKAVAPAAALSVLYVLVYKALDYGPRGTSFYLDPLGHPADFAVGLLNHVPALLAGALTAFPAQLWGMAEYRLPLVVVGALAALAVVGGLAWARSRLDGAEVRAVATWGAGALMSLLPVAAAPPSERQLLVPVVGLSVVLASLFVTLAGEARARQRRPVRLAAGILLLSLVTAHLVAAPFGRVMQIRGLARLDATLAAVADELPEPLPAPERHDLVLLNVPDLFLMLYLPLVWEYEHRPEGISWNPLAGSPHDLRLWRQGPRTLIAESIEGVFLEGDLEDLLRPPGETVTPGQVMSAPAFRVEVVETENGGPRRLAFHFERRLEDPRLFFYVWRDDRLVGVTPPGEGEVLVVEAAPGLLGLL